MNHHQGQPVTILNNLFRTESFAQFAILSLYGASSQLATQTQFARSINNIYNTRGQLQPKMGLVVSNQNVTPTS